MTADSMRPLVTRALAEVEIMLPPKVVIPEDMDAPLLDSSGGPLGSLGVVNLMVALERYVQSEFGKQISLAEALTEPAESSPFRSRRSIETYLSRLIFQDSVEGET